VGGDGEEGVREHGQGDVPVPGAVAADLVVVQAGLVLRFGEAVLDSPSRARDRRQLGQGGRLRTGDFSLVSVFMPEIGDTSLV